MREVIVSLQTLLTRGSNSQYWVWTFFPFFFLFLSVAYGCVPSNPGVGKVTEEVCRKDFCSLWELRQQMHKKQPLACSSLHAQALGGVEDHNLIVNPRCSSRSLAINPSLCFQCKPPQKKKKKMVTFSHNPWDFTRHWLLLDRSVRREWEGNIQLVARYRSRSCHLNNPISCQAGATGDWGSARCCQ